MIFVEIAHNVQSIFLYGCDVTCQHQKAKILGSTIIARFWPYFLGYSTALPHHYEFLVAIVTDQISDSIKSARVIRLH